MSLSYASAWVHVKEEAGNKETCTEVTNLIKINNNIIAIHFVLTDDSLAQTTAIFARDLDRLGIKGVLQFSLSKSLLLFPRQFPFTTSQHEVPACCSGTGLPTRYVYNNFYGRDLGTAGHHCYVLVCYLLVLARVCIIWNKLFYNMVAQRFIAVVVFHH